MYEVSLGTAADSFKNEPEWVVEQLLKRKRAEIVDLWEERESNLREIRAKEARLEEREKKRQRYNEKTSGKDTEKLDSDDEEWLLGENDDEDVPQFSATVKEEPDTIDDGDQVKVSLCASPGYISMHVTYRVIDILYVEDTLSTVAICI